MVPSGLPTGTVSSGRPGPSVADDRDPGRDPDRDACGRIAELERENEALRAAVERQRRENERIVERYERLLERERNCGSGEPPASTASAADESEQGVVDRIASALGRRR
jgi:hypothetical protein